MLIQVWVTQGEGELSIASEADKSYWLNKDQFVLIDGVLYQNGSQVAQKWLQSFPQTYFGFTRWGDSFDKRQKDALRRMDESRSLLVIYSPTSSLEAGNCPVQLRLGPNTRRCLVMVIPSAWRLYQERREPDCLP